MVKSQCISCGEPAHNFKKDEFLNCIPPANIVEFGTIKIKPSYRKKLFQKHPNYTVEEIVGTYLGHNPYYPKYEGRWKIKETD